MKGSVPTFCGKSAGEGDVSSNNEFCVSVSVKHEVGCLCFAILQMLPLTLLLEISESKAC